MHNLHDLFIHELQDLYSAENQITKALPKMINSASNGELKKGFELHLKQTEQQIERLKQIEKEMKLSLGGVTCKGMQGLVKEGETAIKESEDSEVLDAALISVAQRVEHYEIAGYGTAATYAKLMKHKNALKLLKETLDEEEKTDKKLSKLAQKSINKKALN